MGSAPRGHQGPWSGTACEHTMARSRLNVAAATATAIASATATAASAVTADIGDIGDREDNRDDSLVVKHITLPILAILMITGNGMLILVTLRNKNLHTVTNYFIVSLAFSDLLMGFPVLPLLVAAEEGLLGASPTVCLVVFCMAITQVLVSCLLLMSIAGERYIAIVRPLWHHTMLGMRNSIVIIVVCWVYALLIGCLPLFGWNAIGYHNEALVTAADAAAAAPAVEGAAAKCDTPAPAGNNRTEPFQCRYHTVITGSYAAFMYPGHFVLLWVCLIVFYGHIYARSRDCGAKDRNIVRRLSSSSLHPAPGAPPPRRAKENWRALCIITVIVGYFLLSWLGMVIWYGIWFKGFTVNHVTSTTMPLPMWFYTVSVTLAFGNSAVNPFIYGLGNRSVRRAGLKMLRCRAAKSSSQPPCALYQDGMLKRSATTKM